MLVIVTAQDLTQLQTIDDVKLLMDNILGVDAASFLLKDIDLSIFENLDEVCNVCHECLVNYIDVNPTKFMNLQPGAEAEIKSAKPRKVRDSKLQRMAQAFKTQNEDGTYKKWSIEELMTQSGVSKKIAGVYISILRSASDRFQMQIEKDVTSGMYSYSPEIAK